MFNVVSLGLFLVAVCIVLPEPILGDCWDTGCQLNSWAVRGCEQYNRYEAGRRNCNGGIIYTCCSKSGGNEVNTNGGNYGDLTWYELGLTACGRYYTDNDLVAALAFGHFTTPNPNLDPICGRQIRIVDPSSQRSVVVRVEDKCAGCSMNDVDVSPAAFKALRSLDVGRFKVNWSFI
uniref:Secreted Papain inhibitor-like protein n=1 Tax=Pristhesancus plagipennis TaxID=1955184 RepID=A0A2K8JLV0_PRIPG|nr:secreted Papain inhibitor-like protein [Pristhesancus plagipennis]